ncbi:MAG TPA: WhiB family transcriptional regulator [Nevskiaceae bacterium]|nr:WhiB family transcriptional regulator [Nevskiaceae bacterium]
MAVENQGSVVRGGDTLQPSVGVEASQVPQNDQGADGLLFVSRATAETTHPTEAPQPSAPATVWPATVALTGAARSEVRARRIRVRKPVGVPEGKDAADLSLEELLAPLSEVEGQRPAHPQGAAFLATLLKIPKEKSAPLSRVSQTDMEQLFDVLLTVHYKGVLARGGGDTLANRKQQLRLLARGHPTAAIQERINRLAIRNLLDAMWRAQPVERLRYMATLYLEKAKQPARSISSGPRRQLREVPSGISITPNKDELEDGDWHTKAKCTEVDPDTMHPGNNTHGIREAKKVCRGCPVTLQCGQWALGLKGDQWEEFGVWGGMSERERRRIRKKLLPSAGPADN